MNQLIKIGLIGIAACCTVIFHSCSNGVEKNRVKEKSELNLITKKSSTNLSQTKVSQKETPTNFVRSGKQPLRSQFVSPSSGNDQNSLEALKRSLQSKPQTFTISSNTDTIIVGNAGTRVHIPAASFVDQEGKDIEGEMVFSLIECYTPLEMFAHNLSTRTIDGKLLETGGSVFIDAKQAGDPVQLKRGRSLKIDFPKGEEDLAGMQEFEGVTAGNGVVEWKSPSQSKRGIKKEVRQNNLAQSESGMNVTSNGAPTIYLIEMKKLEGKMDLSSAKLNNGEGTFSDWLEKQSLKDGLLKERFNNGYQVEVKMYFDNKGKVSEIKSTLLVEKSLLDQLTKLFRKAPALKKVHSREPYSVILKGKTINKQKELKDYYTKNDLKWDSSYDFNLSQTNGYYSLNIPWIGWVNCDKFRDNPAQRVSMAVNKSENTSVFMVFTKVASQIYPTQIGNEYQFSNIPLGEPIRLIALRVEKDTIFLERLDTKVVSGNVKVAPSIKASKEDIKQAFEL